MRIGVVAAIVAALLVACTPDAPSRDGAIEAINEVCTETHAELDALGLPTDVFAVSAVADQAFAVVSDGVSDLDSKGLSAMDDEKSIQRYLRGAVAMNNALAALSRAAALEDVRGMESALSDADAAGAELDAAAAELGLDPTCGAEAWRGGVLLDARTVVGLERDLMTPSGDYVVDVGTVCDRYERRLGLAADPDSADAARGAALVIRTATAQLGSRLALLTPPPSHADTHFDLVSAAARVTNLLEPSETLAIDGKDAELQALVKAADADLTEIGRLLDLTGAVC